VTCSASAQRERVFLHLFICIKGKFFVFNANTQSVKVDRSPWFIATALFLRSGLAREL